MEELSVILKARQFIKDAGIDSIPVDLKRVARAANAKIRVSSDFRNDESGQTFPLHDKNIIMVNGSHSEERQRFTVLHEIAHIVLELPSQHHGKRITTSSLISYRRRPKEEILCDVFASECLLPFAHFKTDVDDMDVSFDAVKELAARYNASITATSSRFAVNCSEPCAFVLMEGGKIRYVSMSKHLRERKGWIDFGIAIPKGSVAHRLVHGKSTENHGELLTATWFNNGVRGFDYLAEEAMLLGEWDQCLSLIWFDENVRPNDREVYYHTEEDEPLVDELDGILPWPNKRK